MEPPIALTFTNWNGSAASTPRKFAEPHTVDELVEVVKNVEQYPSPVRAVGSLHSLVPCFATTGTHVSMRYFNSIAADSAANTITVGANIKLVQIRDVLRRYGQQLEVTPEIGNATAGAVACCGTKDASLGATGLGQVSSTVIGVRFVNARGEVESISEESDPERMRAFRSSYGLLGVVFEVTFRTRPAVLLDHEYQILSLDPVPTLERVRGAANGVLAFLLPYTRQIVVERRYVHNGAAPISAFSRAKRRTRDYLWEQVASFVPTYLPHDATYDLVDRGLGAILGGISLLGGFRAHRADSTIDFQFHRSHYFDFTFCAIPASRWLDFVPTYLGFCSEFRSRTGFRVSMLSEVYLMNQDTHSLLSPSAAENVFTMDVTDHRPNHPHWNEFNKQFNVLVAEFGGRPLLNQTKQLSREVVHQTLGDDWRQFLELRQAQDPEERFLSDYFRQLM